MENKQRTFLVTGGAGFIGSHLVDALVARGDAVAVVDDMSSGKSGHLNPAAEFYEIDIRDNQIITNIFLPRKGAALQPCTTAVKGWLAYRTMIHEAGHALGLTDYPYPNVFGFFDLDSISDPGITGSVMNYDSRTGVAEPNCFPGPMDIFALQALYQNIGR